MNFQNSLWPHSGSSPSRMTLRHGRSSQLCGFRWEKAGFVVVGLGSWEGRNPERAGEKHAEIWEEGHGLRSVGTGRGQTSMLQKPEQPPQVPSSHWLCVPLFLFYPEAPRFTIPETPCPSDPRSHPFLVLQNHGVPQQPWYPIPPAIRSAAVTALNTQVGNLKPAQVPQHCFKAEKIAKTQLSKNACGAEKKVTFYYIHATFPVFLFDLTFA